MTEIKQQLAVEWFFEKDTELTILFLEDKITNTELFFKKKELLQQAKEMEKQKMIEFGIMVQNNALNSYRILSPIKLYNETYGDKND